MNGLQHVCPDLNIVDKDGMKQFIEELLLDIIFSSLIIIDEIKARRGYN